MRPLIYTAFISLDGVVQAPGPEEGYRNGGWTFQDIEYRPEVYDLKAREQDEAGALLLGRTSYELFAPVWPTMTEEFPATTPCPSTSCRPRSPRTTWSTTGARRPSSAASTTSRR